ADSATFYLNQASELAEQLEAAEKISEAYLQQGIHFIQIGRFTAADSLLQIALEVERSLSRPLFLLKIYQNAASAKKELQQNELAFSYLNRAETIAKNLQDSEKYLANIYLDRAAFHFQQGHIEVANEYDLIAIDSLVGLEDWESATAAALNIGINYLGIEDYEKTEFYGLKGLEYAQKSENSTYLAYSYKILTAASSELGKQDTALNYALQSLVIWQKIGNPYEIGFSNRFIGKVLKNKGEYQQALPYLIASVDDFRAISVPQQLLYSLAELGDNYIRSGQKKAGLTLLKEAEKLLELHPQTPVDEQSIFKLLEDGYAAANEFDAAYNFRKKHDAIQDSVQQKERIQQIQELETQYQVKEKEAQLAIQDTQLEQQNNRLLISGIIGLSLAGIAFLAFRLARQRRNVNEKLRALDTTKSTFFANVSHELRTPLTLIIAPLENAMAREKNQLVRRDLELAHQSGKNLLQLVNEILDLSKLESDKLDLHFSDNQLVVTIKRIFFAYESLAKLQEIKLNFQSEIDEDLWVKLDLDKLSKILNNLISNAIKYVDEEGEVALILTQVNERIFEIKVVDNGTGIATEDLPHIFDRYYQSGEVMRGGTGIGLALAKELSAFMGGSLKVKSQLKKGSTFSLQLPLRVIPTPTLLPPPEFAPNTIEASTVAYQPQLLNAQKAKVLIVEDQPEMSAFLVRKLSPFYNCTIAANGKMALEKTTEQQFDLITSDVMMPQLDGFEFLSELRRRELQRRTPVLMLTARALEADKLRGFQLGVDDYLTKPFSINELLARLENLLTNKKVRETEIIAEEVIESQDEQLIKQLEQTVVDNLRQSNFKTAELAASINYSQRQLERITKRLTGLSPNNFIKEIRLQRARQLLETKQLGTVAEVSYAIGFADAGYFTKVYQKRFGVKPSEV
ncbi:MAG: response regulator, partial [Saprospiraceae bacterium]